MNKFDKAVNKKTSELISQKLLLQEAHIETYNKFKIIARAMVREELRGLKPNENPKSLYNKTWKAAKKYSDDYK